MQLLPDKVNAAQIRLFREEERASEPRAARAAFRTDRHDGVFVMQALWEEVCATECGPTYSHQPLRHASLRKAYY